MSTDLFHRAGRLRRGYDRAQVGEFLARARQVWDTGGPPGPVTSWHVRTVGFDLRRNGYRVEAVDEALDRIEDAFVSREERSGPADRTEAEDAVVARCELPDGQRFPRARFLGQGYRAGDVDDLCTQVHEHLVSAGALTVEDVRAAVFRPRRGARAYREATVDAFLDRVVDTLRRRDS